MREYWRYARASLAALLLLGLPRPAPAADPALVAAAQK